MQFVCLAPVRPQTLLPPAMMGGGRLRGLQLCSSTGILVPSNGPAPAPPPPPPRRPPLLRRLPRVLQLAAKALLQLVTLLWALLWALPRPDVILLQLPPALPTMVACRLAAMRHRARLVYDWHNFAFTLMAIGMGRGHPLVR